jgi:hypothetical protein
MNAREVVTQSLQLGCAARRLNGICTRRSVRVFVALAN